MQILALTRRAVGMAFAMGQRLMVALCVFVVMASLGRTVNMEGVTPVPTGRETFAMGTASAPMTMRGEASARVKRSMGDTPIAETSNQTTILVTVLIHVSLETAVQQHQIATDVIVL